ncbi:MAG: starch synthase [Candidatus Sumerlaeota bacterium]|nr:starch synthase [Candidatus Sumerlaeota bacterium]
MRILMVSSEMSPFAKTGGLADVVGALPRELARRGHDVRGVLPLYRTIDRYQHRLLPLLRRIQVQWGTEEITGEVMRCSLPTEEEVPVYFIHQNFLFGRGGLYGENGRDYEDNDKRFAFFCLAALYAAKALDWPPDIIHLHDWQAALIAPLLRHHPAICNDPFYQKTRVVFTIHNLAYQGIVSSDILPHLRLPWSLCTPDGMEFHRAVSLLKAGLVYSDALTTVSPTYASEIQTEENGKGLDGVLRARSGVLRGILNGIDDEVWNPETDPNLAGKYSVKNLAGKKKCKAEILKLYGLDPASDAPLVGVVGRLDDQKGFDLIKAIMPRLLESGARFILLGTGQAQHEEDFARLAAENPAQAGAVIDFNEGLSHMIEAGADIFLMPSRFEPSGLNQLYSMRYGTPPVVRRTGGLADSVVGVEGSNIESGEATGFVFDLYDPDALWHSLKQALDLYTKEPKRWQQLMKNGMKRDFSWRQSTAAYEEVYQEALDAPPAP